MLPSFYAEMDFASAAAIREALSAALAAGDLGYFLEHGRVALSSGPDFGPAGRGFARQNLGTSWALVEQAVKRMRTALDIPPAR